jgi:ubiquinone/menaquinone biosynthesis C-methylase UbiE
MKDRKLKEKAFHNFREHNRHQLDSESFSKRYSNFKFYSIIRKRQEFVLDWLRQNCDGKVALDYCCGDGEMSLELVNHGAFVYGIDLSDESVRTAKGTLTRAGYGDRSQFCVMDAENLSFANDFFDVAICSGVLHHLDLKYAFRELQRVLKPEGKILCIEALGYNPAIQWYRRKTPEIRTEWEMNHILTMRDLRKAKRYFKLLDLKFFHLFSVLGVPFRNTFFFKPLLTMLEGIDLVVLMIPFIQLLAWQMVFVLSKKTYANVAH